MNDVPPTQPPSDDIDSLYRSASALDPSRPSERTRQAVLAHARKVAVSHPHIAAKRRRERWWRPAVFGTLAAAGLAGLLVLPQILTPRVAPKMTHASAEHLEAGATAPASAASTPQKARPLPTEPGASALAAPQPPAPPEAAGEAPMLAPSTSGPVAPMLAPRAAAPMPALPAPQAAAPLPSPSASAVLAPMEPVPRPPPATPATTAKRSPPPQARDDDYTASTRERDAIDRRDAKTNTAPQPEARANANADVAGSPESHGQPGLDSITITAQRKAPVSFESISPVAVIAPPDSAPAANSASASAASKIGSPQGLRLAAESGDLKRLQRFLDQATNINSRDDAGRTALLLATIHGQTKAVELLLAHGADPNTADASGMTPLSAAVAGNRSAIIRILKNAGAR